MKDHQDETRGSEAASAASDEDQAKRPTSHEGLRLLAAFRRIDRPVDREAVLAMVEQIAARRER